MTELIKTGRRRTILISISILLISIHTIYLYNKVQLEIDSKKLIQQIIRFVLTFGLLYSIYIGKNWAKNIAIVLFTFGIVFSVYNLFNYKTAVMGNILILEIIFIYSLAVYHFLFSSSFAAFQEYQNKKKSNV
ncbi:hypothetical protein [Flavobacterium sp. J27]|uniref:hypothetical protein n=1 Tax=Flavobacterium sp. J27 TaxID=2060419 RepID=UPI001030F637|nr:hypothetical protein [Flavobacterium sp. J27]